ncbi:hypothetical protein D3C78_1917570 [compost metagenome]
MARDEPRCAQVIFFKEFQKAGGANFASKKTARDIVRRILPPIGTEPTGYRIDINAN